MNLPGELRIGQGLDFHPLVDGRPLILGGVKIPHGKGLDGHSDADVLLHALIDALLGAAGRPDLGQRFPGDDKRWQGVSSLELLKTAWNEVGADKFQVLSVDCTIVAEAPRLSPYFEAMRANISGVLGISPGCCGLKATKTEGLGFVGRGEGIVASAVALLWRESRTGLLV